MSKIEWTGETWNPIVGCSVVSPGCTNCYAMRDAWRKGSNPKTPQYHGLTRKVNGNPVWTGEVRLVDHKLTEPLKRRKPTTYFVNSMGDLFHESVPDEWIDLVIAVMASAPRMTFQVLTKRAGRMREYFDRLEKDGPAALERYNTDPYTLQGRAARAAMPPDSRLSEPPPPMPELRAIYDRAIPGLRKAGIRTDERSTSGVNWPEYHWRSWPLPNVHLGVSAEDQARADERIPDLLETPAAVRFVSAEPLLGPVDLTHIDLPGGYEEVFPLGLPEGREAGTPQAGLDWVIVGGESGPGARPCNVEWIRSAVAQCQAAGVPVFVKQLGACFADPANGIAGSALTVDPDVRIARRLADRKGGDMAEWPADLQVREVPR